MNILYVGDIMGKPGLEVVEKLLPRVVKDNKIDLVIAQAENVSEGKGTTQADFRKLQSLGIDFCTGGNWSFYREEIKPLFSDENEPIIAPANYPESNQKGYKFITKNGKTILVISLLGQIIGKDSDKKTINPLKRIDKILEDTKDKKPDAIVINFHGDYSSEKVIIGHYLDGRATAVIGDHWHVPTADARVLPKGTAHVTDVGMCGALNASLGISFEPVIERWYTGHPTKNTLELSEPRQFNAALIKTNSQGLADSIKHLNLTI